MEKSLEFRWKGIYKGRHDLIDVLIRSLQLLYREYTKKSIRIKEHSTYSSLGWPWGCHLLSQYLSFYQIIKDNSICPGFASQVSCERKLYDVCACPKKDKRDLVIPVTDTTHSNLPTISWRSVCEQGLIGILTSQKERANRAVSH